MILQIIYFIVSKGFCRYCSQRYLHGQVVFNSTLVIICYIQNTQTLYFTSKHHLFFLKILFYANIKNSYGVQTPWCDVNGGSLQYIQAIRGLLIYDCHTVH